MKRSPLSTLFSVIILAVFVLSSVQCAPSVPATSAPATSAPATTAPQAQAQATATTAAQPDASAGPVSPAGEFPVVQERITLKIYLRPTTGVKDWNTNDFTQWVEEKTNIDLEIETPPMNEAVQKLNLLLASGSELPDIIMGFGLPLDQQQVLAQQGLIIPLNDLIDEYGYEYATVLKERPILNDIFTLADGKMYAVPHVNECYHCSLSQKLWIYKPWLEKLNLEVPTTTEEFYQVLKAFKEQDPNGNGIADEIPLSGSDRGWQSHVDTFLMNSFVLNNRLTTPRSFYIEGGMMKAAFVEDGWREGLRYLNKLYSEGLIDPEIFSNDGDKLRALGENPDVAIMGATGAGWYGVFTQNNGPSGRYLEYEPIPPLEGPTGIKQVPENIFLINGGGAAVITKDSKYPEAAFRVIDLMFSYESSQRSVFGRKGEEWEDAPAGTESIAEGEAKYVVLKTYGADEHTIHWAQAAPTYRTMDFRNSQAYSEMDPLERKLFVWSRDIYDPFGNQNLVPPLLFTPDQSKTLGELNTALYALLDQYIAGFITGQFDIDNDWDSYLSEMDANGLQDFIKIHQEAYDSKYK